MKGDCRAAPIGMSELLVRAPLPHLDKTEFLEYCCNFFGLENWPIGHASIHRNGLNSGEFCFKNGFAVLEQHLDDFFQVLAEFV